MNRLVDIFHRSLKENLKESQYLDVKISTVF